MENFEKLMRKRYYQKIRNENKDNRLDKLGNPIKFNLSLEEYVSLFEPYKDDSRLYLNTTYSERLVLCRLNDIGNYEIGNVYVDTCENNIRIASKNKHISNPDFAKNIGKMGAEALRLTHPNGGFFDKYHTEETKRRMRKTCEDKGLHKKEKNSQFGTYWLTNGKNSIKWSDNKGDWPEGFYRGRKMK